YRKTGKDAEPVPEGLDDVSILRPDLDGHLVVLEGILLETLNRAGETRLMLQKGGEIAEAVLDGERLEYAWAADSVLSVAGVYTVVLDEYRQPRGFRLLLRSPQ